MERYEFRYKLINTVYFYVPTDFIAIIYVNIADIALVMYLLPNNNNNRKYRYFIFFFIVVILVLGNFFFLY